MRWSSLALLVALAAAMLSVGTAIKFERPDHLDVIVSFEGSPMDVIPDNLPTNREERLDTIVDHLQKLTKRAADRFFAELPEQHVPSAENYELLWITNQLYLRNFSRAVFEESKFPTVSEWHQAGEMHVQGYSVADKTGTTSVDTVRRLGGPAVWGKGYTGQGIIVGSIDTGALATHDLLKNNFRLEYGWLDPRNHSTAPYDDIGRGTHSLAIAVGSDGHGVAPGAQWSACRACGDTSCSEIQVLQCAQQMTCPRNRKSGTSNCKEAPHVVLNGWEHPRANSTFQRILDVWQRARIIPVFGHVYENEQFAPPRTPNSIIVAVGYYDGNAMKSQGESDVSAMGIQVESASVPGNRDLAYRSGGSVAAAHVVGTIALLLSADPDIPMPDCKEILRGGTFNKASISADAIVLDHLSHGVKLQPNQPNPCETREQSKCEQTAGCHWVRLGFNEYCYRY